MSQTLDDQQDAANDPAGAFDRLGQMLRQGRSFSGRERNCCFLNTHGERFANISAVSGIDFPDDGRAVAVVDWDHDGDQDLWISNRNAPRLRLLRNDTSRDNHYLSLRLEGDGKTTNRDAIGARVEVVSRNSELGTRKSELGARNSERGTRSSERDEDDQLGVPSSALRAIATLRAGEGFLAQRSKWLHFGLGDVDQVAGVVVRWPGGAAESFDGLQVDRRYRLVQGTGIPVELTARRTEVVLTVAEPAIPLQAGSARVPLVSPLTMLPIAYYNFDGGSEQQPVGSGRPLLVQIWASWCAPCLEELSDLAKHREAIDRARIDVLALSVDGLAKTPVPAGADQKLIHTLAFPYPCGRARPELLELLQEFHDLVVPMHRSLPLPTSFLISADGRLTVIYKGPVSAAQLLKDAQLTGAATRAERLVRAAPLPGTAIEHPQLKRTADVSEARLHYRFALLLRRAGLTEEAMENFRTALTFDPDFGDAHFNLGYLYLHQSDVRLAKHHFQETIRAKPDSAFGHYYLGIMLLAERNAAAAVRHFERALELKPGYELAEQQLQRARAALKASNDSP